MLFTFSVNTLRNLLLNILLGFKWYFLTFQAVFVILEFSFSLDHIFLCIFCFLVNMTRICISYVLRLRATWLFIIRPPSSSFINCITFFYLMVVVLNIIVWGIKSRFNVLSFNIFNTWKIYFGFHIN